MSERAFDKFTKRAKQVLQIATEEARAFNHPYIGTEHILLGLIREGEGVAARVLDDLGVKLSQARHAVEFIVGMGEGPTRQDQDLTARAKEGDRLRGRRGQATEPSLYRHRAPAARPGAQWRGRGHRRAGHHGRLARTGAHPGDARAAPGHRLGHGALIRQRIRIVFLQARRASARARRRTWTRWAPT